MRKVLSCITHKRQMIWEVQDGKSRGFVVEYSSGEIIPELSKAKRVADYQKRTNMIGFTQ